MKRSQIDNIISQSISTAANLAVALPKWASWRPAQFQFGDEADGVKRQGLGWKVVDFGLGDFSNCGLVVLLLCNALTDSLGEPLLHSEQSGERNYPATSFSRKFLFVRAGQTEPHHFHRQKARKEVTVLAGGPVCFELAWAQSDKVLSEREVCVQVDGIWHNMQANGSLELQPGETITLPGEMSHIIQILPSNTDAILLETSTANNDRNDNIFPFVNPVVQPIEEDAIARYQLLDEHVVVV
jgi:D-lyxose ketol-isomerase